MKYSEIFDQIMAVLENCETTTDKRIMLNACLNWIDVKEQTKEKKQ